jgi:hypothetical protein
MRGLLFSEFLAFAEAAYGPDVADRLGEATPSGAEGWNPVAAYPHQELVGLVARLAELTGTDSPALLRAFGARLFHRLAALYPGFLVGARSAFPFIAGFQAAIHDELRKVHPDSEVPSIECAVRGADRLELVYTSPRRLGDLAEGLLLGCVDYFGERIAIHRQDVDETGRTVRFTLERAGTAPVP